MGSRDILRRAGRLTRYCVLSLVITSSLLGCDRDNTEPTQPASSVAELDVWVHSGQQSERDTIQNQVTRFNAAQRNVHVKLTVLPEGAYNAQVQAAALADDLPDLLEFDGPFLYNYVWQGHIRELDNLLPEPLKQDLLPSVIQQGTYNGKLYSVATFDSGLGLYGRRGDLQAVGVRIPTTPGEAWRIDEFERLLAALAKRDADGAVLDLKLNYSGEWYTYAFSPVIQSAGGDLIERTSFQRSDGSLNSSAAVEAMTRVQSWFQHKYIDPNLDDAAFTSGRVALSWGGHWDYNRYHAALGEELVVFPLPNFGLGSKTGQGSWNWGITTRSQHPQAAARFLTFLLRPEEVLRMADANGAVPATRSAIRRSHLYGEKGPLRLFVAQLENTAIARPQTPAYPVITSVFQQAFEDIRNGSNVRNALDKAAATIDQDIEDNEGYLVR